MLHSANGIKPAKTVELQNSTCGFNLSNIKQKARLTGYLQAVAAEKRQAAGTVRGQHRIYNIPIKRLTEYGGGADSLQAGNRGILQGTCGIPEYGTEQTVPFRAFRKHSAAVCCQKLQGTFISIR
jgi:hypothetical protein